MAYMRLKHRDAHKGCLLCVVSRTVVHDRVVGSVSFASPGGETLHTSSMAQEITVITPAAANFEFTRWHDPPPRVPSPARNPVPAPPLFPNVLFMSPSLCLVIVITSLCPSPLYTTYHVCHDYHDRNIPADARQTTSRATTEHTF
ncbi:hypothetical protein C8R47DRAFT_375287 [Mycena vitilis]|nr:hypothetical protein C8R47DRAFT_375287 [Mycena vitilis]